MSTLIKWLEAGRLLAERIPYSLVALLARVAAASVFWRSGQTKVEGFLHIKDTTFFLFREEYMVPLLPPDVAAYLTTICGARLFGLPRHRPRLAAFRTRPDRHDGSDPDLRLPRGLAGPHPLVRRAATDRGAGTWRDLARPSHLVARAKRAGTRALIRFAVSRRAGADRAARGWDSRRREARI